MDLKDELIKEHSKKLTEQILDWIGNHEDRFSMLMNVFFSEELLLVQRAAWVVGIAAKKNPHFFYPYLEQAVKKLEENNSHDAVIRNILRVIQDLQIPEQLQGTLFDICLTYVLSPDTPGAIKAFAISTLENICKSFPDLASEVKLILKERIEFESPAVKSRAKRFLKRFS